MAVSSLRQPRYRRPSSLCGRSLRACFGVGATELILDPLWAFLGAFVRQPPVVPAPVRREPIVFSARQMEELRRRKDAESRERVFRPAPPPPFAFGAQEPPARFANDDALGSFAGYGISNGGLEFGPGTGIYWLGYPYLAELSQRPEYRIIVELFADEMTRKWIRFKSNSKEDKTERIKELEAEIKRHRLRDHFRDAKRDDGYFGMGQLYIDIKGISDSPELLRAPLITDPRSIKKGSLKGFKKVEPYWIYPQAYNANDPLRDDFFKPTAWTVMGKTVHATRMLTFIGNPVPDLLKASYSFGGISITQLMKPYVDAFIQTKGNVNELISAFSQMVLSTNMAAYLTDNAAKSLDERVEAFNLYRSNFGTFVVDKETEELKNVSAPLAGLDELQAQAEEHMLIPMRTPLIKAFGLSPSGLNQSDDNQVRSFYDNVNSDQEDQFRAPLEKAIKIIMLDMWGEIDEEIEAEFVPLWQLDDAGLAAVQKTKSDMRLQDIESGQISPEEARQSLIADKDSIYQNLDENDAPGTQEVDGEGNPIHDPETNEIERESEAAGGGGARGAAGGT